MLPGLSSLKALSIKCPTGEILKSMHTVPVAALSAHAAALAVIMAALAQF